MNKRIALYAGSFDPITLGHLDVIVSAWQFFDEVVVALVRNPEKPVLRAEKRLEWVEKATQDFCVEVVSYLDRNILTVKIAKIHGAKFLVRGVKGGTNIEEEMQMAFNNKNLDSTLDTIWFPVPQENYHVSSTAVKSILQCYDESNDENDALRYRLMDSYLPLDILDDVIENRNLYL